jgi:mannose-6-phosphate isomerase-like protein (cupin superfamily)
MDRTGASFAAQHRRVSGYGAGRAAPTHRHIDPAAIARRLGAVVLWPGAAAVSDRSWRIVAQTRDFDAWLIAWPGETTAELHDHGGSRGALHVISGSLVETVPWRDDRGVLTVARREVHSDVTLAFGAGHVHDVRNEALVPALSLHVYSPPLTSMIYYERSGDRLMPREKVWDAARDQTSHADGAVARLVAP